jgi:actin
VKQLSLFLFNEGDYFDHSTQKINLGGNNLSEYMAKLLEKRGLSSKTREEKVIVRDIKEKLTYVSSDLKEDLEKASESNNEKEYELPDGKLLKIDVERFMCPEALFQPSLLGMECKGIHELLYSSIEDCDNDLKNILYENIVLNGGSTMFNGIEERLSKEISKLTSNSKKNKS